MITVHPEKKFRGNTYLNKNNVDYCNNKLSITITTTREDMRREKSQAPHCHGPVRRQMAEGTIIVLIESQWLESQPTSPDVIALLRHAMRYRPSLRKAVRHASATVRSPILTDDNSTIVLHGNSPHGSVTEAAMLLRRLPITLNTVCIFVYLCHL